MVTRMRSLGDPSGDLRRDPFRFVGSGHEGLEAHGHGVVRGPFGAELLDDAGPHLEPIRIVEANQPMTRGEDRRRGGRVP